VAHFDVIVIGAGAAGLMCAMRAGQRGRKTLLLEHGEQAGAKILISGGGRCNFTNTGATAERYFSGNPHFSKSALKTYTQHDFIALVEKHKIAYHEKTLGQLFCDVSARQITAMLLQECAAAHVDLRLQQHVTDVTKADIFTVKTDKGDFTSNALVLATGGLSIPKMGATDFTHRIAKRFGLPLTEILPGLVPLTFSGDALAFMQPLSGVSTEVIAKCGKTSFREDMIFTHRGLSGPAILQISSVWRAGQSITLDLLPGTDAAAFLIERKKVRPKAELKSILAEVFPQRLSQQLAQQITAHYFPAGVMGNMPDKKLQEVAASLKAWVVTPSGTEGYAKAEVTLGGVDTTALSSKTMESTAVQGLYVIGEAVDVTGWLGGYNFQWAWSSGWAAGSAV
jgi:predicted Rossmann fold flavoprotein